MITSIELFLRYFDAVHRRAMRDIAALPFEADGWAPGVGDGEGAWSINVLVGHMAGSRLYFASAYRGEGWISPEPPDTSRRANWLPMLDDSAHKLALTLKETPDSWLSRKVAMIDSDGALSGWRILMMMVEHDIHHRSQIDTYAGINGWPVPDIYGRSAETIGSLQKGQRRSTPENSARPCQTVPKLGGNMDASSGGAYTPAMSDIAAQLDVIMEGVRARFISKNTARETALPLCREATRLSANAIRAVHRDEFEKAREMTAKAGAQLKAAKDSLRQHPDIYFAGFVHDGQKEYAEAAITLAMIEGADLPTPNDLEVEHAAYLNGMGEAIGELRRHLLDTLRSGDIDKCEQWLTAMDEMYAVMVTVDYPDAMTGGLRRTTDNVRGILERTRGDYTMSLQQKRLESKIDQLNN